MTIQLTKTSYSIDLPRTGELINRGKRILYVVSISHPALGHRTMTTSMLSRWWIKQIIQVFILRIKYK
jgi:hypothetical protein